MPVALVINDAATERRQVSELLVEIPGLVIEFAENPSEALQKIAASKPDVVIASLKLPEMDGLELLVQLAKEDCSLPIVLLTGDVSEKIVLTGLRLGAATYVPKEQMDTYLVEVVQSLLQVCQSAQSIEHVVRPLGHGEIVFTVDNDVDMIPSIVSYVQNLVSAVGLCDDSNVVRVCIAVEEALRNAMFHGNLEISSEVREGDCEVYEKILEHRTTNAPWASRKLFVSLHIDEKKGTFTIRDEGPGFDPTKLPDPTDPANLDKVSGRGLLLIRTFMDEVSFNGTGNSITMVKHRAAEEAAG